MKNILSLAALLLIASCAAPPPLAPPPSPSAAEAARLERYGREYERERHERVTAPPRLGMSREQVRAEYGRPVSISSNTRWEIWTYSFNGMDARPSSPFHDTSATVRCVVYFNPGNGKVGNFQWTASNPAVQGGAGTASHANVPRAY